MQYKIVVGSTVVFLGFKVQELSRRLCKTVFFIYNTQIAKEWYKKDEEICFKMVRGQNYAWGFPAIDETSYFLAVCSALWSRFKNSGSCPIGSMIGLQRLAMRIASGGSNSAKWIKHATPVVPARWAPAKQWTSTFSPLAIAFSMNSKRGPVNAINYSREGTHFSSSLKHSSKCLRGTYLRHWNVCYWHTKANG